MTNVLQYARALAVAFILGAAALPPPALAQSIGVFANFQPTGQVNPAVTSVSAATRLGSVAPAAWVCNTGLFPAFVALGNLNVGASAANGFPVSAGFCASLYALGTTHIAAIAPSGDTTLSVTTGTGWPAVAASGPQSITIAPTSSSITVTPVTVGVTSALALAAGTRSYLKVCNLSTVNFAAYNFNGAAVLNGAGSINLTPYQCDEYAGYFIPNNAVNMIASGASTPVTVLTK